jgi:hypothetical protein
MATTFAAGLDNLVTIKPMRGTLAGISRLCTAINCRKASAENNVLKDVRRPGIVFAQGLCKEYAAVNFEFETQLC